MKQITIITPPDTPGILADITEKLAAKGVNILDIDGTDDHAHGVIVLNVEPYDIALRTLAEAGYQAMSEEVIIIRIKDEPGALARIAARFRDAHINIRAMRIVRRDTGWASVALSTDDNHKSKTLLTDCMV